MTDINNQAGFVHKLTACNSWKDGSVKEMDVAQYAREMFDQYGAKAIAIAAQKAKSADEGGEAGVAKKWRQIEQTLAAMRGPAES